MKLFRKISALIMVMALLLSFSLSVWAVDYNAANADDLLNAFWDESGEDVNINMTGDVDAEYYYLTGQEGINYTIGSDNGSSLSNAFFGGETNVTINADVAGEFGAGEQADVTINGDVDGYANAWGDAALEINGDVNGQLYAGENAEVSVDGDVNGSVTAYGDATADIAGDVTNEENWSAISADENATVNVDGNVTSDTEGIYAWMDSTVTVGGDVVAGDNIDTGDPSFTYGGSAVNASGSSTVSVGGDAIGGDAKGEGMVIGGNGVFAWTDGENAPTVTVGGDAIGGNATSSSEESFSAQGGSGVQMPGSANVTVGGDAIGGDGEGVESVPGAGAVVSSEAGAAAGSLTIEGAVVGGEGDIDQGDLNVYAWSDPEAENQDPAEVPEISIGYAEEIFVGGFGEEEDAKLQAELEAQVKKPQVDFWKYFLDKINAAQPGDEITINLYNRMSISAQVINAARAKEVTLIIQWNGGDDLVIDKNFTEEVSGAILLKDLAELLKK